jgi:hypothetical protein
METIPATKTLSDRDMTSISVDVDRPRFLYFSFVVCYEWMVATGIFLSPSYLNA